MMSAELNITAPEGVLPAQPSTELLQALRTHFDQVYRIKNDLPRILREMLFETGSHIRAVIPESSIDDAINRASEITMESISDIVDRDGSIRPFGFLGSPKQEKTSVSGAIAQEDLHDYRFNGIPKEDRNIQLKGNYSTLFGDTKGQGVAFEQADPNLTVTDNPFILKYPAVQARVREQRVQKLVRSHTKDGLALESQISKLDDRRLASMLYRSGGTRRRIVSIMKTQEQLSRRTIGLPLVLQLPSESVIPVHVPGQENAHVGYFVLLDANGNPVSRKTQRDHYSELSQRLQNGSTNNPQNSFTSQIIQRVNSLINGFDCNNREHLDYSFRVYQDMVEQDLLSRLKNGVYNNGVALANNEEIYRIMLARTLASQQSQLLFLPVEFVTYFAFRYNADGIGKSLLDDMKILNSLRVMLMFANTMASIRNSVGMQTISIKLDEADPDPYKTIERQIHEIIRVKQQAFPIAVSSPVDVTDFLQRSGIDFKFSGHPGLPDIEIEKTDSSRQVVKPDAELEDSLRKRAIMSTGLNPETVDQGFTGEFATSVVANNILLSRRVYQLQQDFCPMLADHMRKIVRSSADLLQQMRTIIASSEIDDVVPQDERDAIFGTKDVPKPALVEYLLNEFIRGMEINLPSPNVSTLENQFSAFESFVKILDPALDAWVASEFFTEGLVGQISMTVEDIKKLIRAYFVRRWMAENGVLPELSAITAEGENSKPALDLWEMNKDHVEALMRSLSKFVTSLTPAKQATDTVLQGAQGDEQDASSFGSGSNGGESALDSMASGSGSGGGSTDAPESGEGFGSPEDLGTNPIGGDEATPQTGNQKEGDGDDLTNLNDELG